MSKKGELQKDYQYLVGMTVVDKLGDLSGRQVVRINASDQVFLKDTSFGSNFPVSRFSYIPKSRKEKQYDAIEATSVDYADEFDTKQPTPPEGHTSQEPVAVDRAEKAGITVDVIHQGGEAK